MGEGQLRDWLDGIAGPGGVVSAAEAVVTAGGAEAFRHAAGFRVGGERLSTGARFDAASLTKPWTATLALALDRAGALALDLPIGSVYRETAPDLSARTLEDLLRHRSGLPAWTPLGVRLGRRLGDTAALEELLTRGEPARAGATAGTYSDLGYLLWGLAAERATGEPLAALLDRHVAAPLGLPPLGTLAADPPGPVECRLDNGKEVELARAQGIELALQRAVRRGRPQDGNARLLARLTGHAGLFLTVDELVALGEAWRTEAPPLDGGRRASALAGDGAWALGWARAGADGSGGPALAAGAFGHSGFTGGSLWIDPERGLVLALLAHRLSSALDFNPFRREFHRLAIEAFG